MAPLSGRFEKLVADGSAATKAGDPKLALSRFQEAVPLSTEQLGDERLLGSALSGLGWAQWATGQYELLEYTTVRVLDLHEARPTPPARRSPSAV